MTADRADILQRLEQEAHANALRCHRLTTPKDRNPVGLVVLLSGLDPAILKSALADMTEFSSDMLPPLPGKLSSPKTGSLSRNIVELLQIEQARVAKTRLPCALLLVELDDFAKLPASDAAMDHLLSVCLDNLEEIDILSIYERGKLAIILPGINRPLAARRAEAIRQAAVDRPLAESGNSRPISVSIAVSLYQASDKGSATVLLQKTTSHLASRGAEKNCLLFLDPEAAGEDNMQVTVEERLQLFSILDRD